jgi:hypothetical protein
MKKEKITLNFINHTKDTRQKKIVIFQKQQNPDFNRFLIAWKVITLSGEGGKVSFPYSESLKLSISEADGIYTLKYPVQPGFLYAASVPYQGSGYVLSYKGPVPPRRSVPLEKGIEEAEKKEKSEDELKGKRLSSRGKEIQVINTPKRGAIDLLLYRSGLLLSRWHNLLPSRKAIFEIQPMLYITIAIPGEGFKVEEGRVMSRAVLSLPCAKFSLEKLKNADMVIVGTAPENWAIKLQKRKN